MPQLTKYTTKIDYYFQVGELWRSSPAKCFQIVDICPPGVVLTIIWLLIEPGNEEARSILSIKCLSSGCDDQRDAPCPHKPFHPINLKRKGGRCGCFPFIVAFQGRQSLNHFIKYRPEEEHSFNTVPVKGKLHAEDLKFKEFSRPPNYSHFAKLIPLLSSISLLSLK